MGIKPVKIKLNNGTAGGMYILLDQNEIRYTNTDETRPPNRIYKIEIAVEAMFNNKRCRGKKTFKDGMFKHLIRFAPLIIIL